MLISKTATAGILLLLAVLLPGCGRKGPLFMPQMSTKSVPAETASAEQDPAIQSQPVPSQPIQIQPETKK
jgi:predicted small lipoprotein YifL